MEDPIDYSRHTFFNRLGEQIDLNKWVKYYESPDYYKVAQNRIGNTEIVTEWTGIGEDDCIFQTIVRKENRIEDIRTARTESEAVINHTIMKDLISYRQKIAN